MNRTLLSAASIIFLGAVVNGCPRSEAPTPAAPPTGEKAATADSACAMTPIPGLRTDVSPVEGGVRLSLTAPEVEQEKVREHARMMVSMHQSGDDMGMRHMMVPTSRVSVEETTGGAQLTFEGDPKALRDPVEKHARMLETGRCAMMGM